MQPAYDIELRMFPQGLQAKLAWRRPAISIKYCDGLSSSMPVAHFAAHALMEAIGCCVIGADQNEVAISTVTMLLAGHQRLTETHAWGDDSLDQIRIVEALGEFVHAGPLLGETENVALSVVDSFWTLKPCSSWVVERLVVEIGMHRDLISIRDGLASC